MSKIRAVTLSLIHHSQVVKQNHQFIETVKAKVPDGSWSNLPCFSDIQCDREA